MQGFMPGTQPRGTHAFNPENSTSLSATQTLNAVDEEEDGAEDQVGPPFDSPMSNVPAAAFVPPDFDIDSSLASASSLHLPDCSGGSAVASSSSHTRPPSSSSLFPTVHPLTQAHPTQQRDVSMASAPTAISDTATRSSQKRKHGISDAGTHSSQKRKRDARSASGAQPHSSKRRASKNKTDDVNPVIISSALNSTLNRIVDVMERTLDVTAITTAPTSASPHSFGTSPTAELQTVQLLSTPSQPLDPPLASNPSSSFTSPTQLLDQAIQLVSADNSGLSEDEILSASIFFNSSTEEAVRAARTFITLSNNPTVQRRFLLRQLDTAALLPGKGKAKAVEDHMEY